MAKAVLTPTFFPTIALRKGKGGRLMPLTIQEQERGGKKKPLLLDLSRGGKEIAEILATARVGQEEKKNPKDLRLLSVKEGEGKRFYDP